LHLDRLRKVLGQWPHSNEMSSFDSIARFFPMRPLYPFPHANIFDRS
jgi:hypothetical protein